MLKALYYLHFVLWRACRASRDAHFGIFRVQVLLLMVQVSFLAGVLFLITGDRALNIGMPAYLLLTVAPALALNVYLFGDARKCERYESEFAKYPQSRRCALDALAVFVSIGAVLMPVITTYLST